MSAVCRSRFQLHVARRASHLHLLHSPGRWRELAEKSRLWLVVVMSQVWGHVWGRTYGGIDIYPSVTLLPHLLSFPLTLPPIPHPQLGRRMLGHSRLYCYYFRLYLIKGGGTSHAAKKRSRGWDLDKKMNYVLRHPQRENEISRDIESSLPMNHFNRRSVGWEKKKKKCFALLLSAFFSFVFCLYD